MSERPKTPMDVYREKAAALRDEIRKQKLDAYEYAALLTRMMPGELANCGYRNMSGLQAAGESIKRAEAAIEKRIRIFEKENPE